MVSLTDLHDSRGLEVIDGEFLRWLVLRYFGQPAATKIIRVEATTKNHVFDTQIINLTIA